MMKLVYKRTFSLISHVYKLIFYLIMIIKIQINPVHFLMFKVKSQDYSNPNYLKEFIKKLLNNFVILFFKVDY